MDGDEPTFLMTMFCALHDVDPEEVVVVAEQGKAPQAIHLDESRAQVHLGRLGGGLEQRWYLDSGAST